MDRPLDVIQRAFGLPARVLGMTMLALSLASVAPAAAQQAAVPTAAAPAAVDPELASYAKAFVGVGLVRDEFDSRLALAKNKTVELQDQIRVEMKEKVNRTIQATGLTLDAYRRIEYTITIDPARRAAFDQFLTDLSKAG
ncbi:MAG: hypothetical protein EXR95_09340 [Gemmatimonadetes bacterium]|nr:hypothetical protein [Gemmatimonadota bacterium]